MALVLSATIWRTKNVEPRFKHLKVYYSASTDSPKAKHRPNRPYYIVNSNTNQAYYVPDFMMQTIKEGRISWTTYSNEEKLTEYFVSQNINRNNIDATDEQLWLWFLPNGKIVGWERKINSKLLPKLMERKSEGKLKNYQIIFIYPRYCWLFRLAFMEHKLWPTARRIIVNYSNNTAFGAPAENLDLYRKGIVDIEGASLSFQNIVKWCKQKRNLDYSYRTFSVEELLEESQVSLTP